MQELKSKSDLKVLNFEINNDGIGIIKIDYPNEKVNKLSSNVFLELEELLRDISVNMAVKCLVIISGKKDNFIAGADIHELKSVDTSKLASEMSSRGQKIFNRLSRMRMTTIAAINGACLGGGLELALACDYRMISDNNKTILGLPEVKLGLIPGAGGTQRMPRLIGIQKSIEYITSGKNIRPKKALKIGLVDEVIPSEIFEDIVMDRAKDFSKFGKRINQKNNINIKDRLLEETKVGKNLIQKKASEKILSMTKSKYPAPIKALNCIINGTSKSLEEGLDLEAQAFGELCESTVTENLIQIFESTTELKKPYKTNIKEKIPSVKKIGILGSGLMGAGIAKVSLDKDIDIRIKDISEESIGKALKSVREYFQGKVKKKIMKPYDLQMKMDKVSGTTNYSGFKTVDFVIEAVFEDLDLKKSMIKELESIIPDHCVFATNTSSIPISEIAKGSKHPERIIGMHFFSPVEKMPLLEIIITPETADWVIQATQDLGKKMGKTVVIVNDGPGFYTSRIIAPYINEALHILLEGGNVEQVDNVINSFGFPVGPFKLLDEVGIDVGTKVSKLLSKPFPRMTPPERLEVLEKNDRKGRKNARGFYDYSGDAKSIDHTIYDDLPSDIHKKAFTDDEIKKRVVYSFLNEAAFCLEDKIISDAKDGDIGAIFGLGFPPFLGGPFKYMDDLGLENIVKTFEELKSKHGERFKPAEILVKMAKEKKTFYS